MPTSEQSQITNAECIALGKAFADKHGHECWVNLCRAWGMEEIHPRVKQIFVAGLAMGFVEALKVVRDGTLIEEISGESHE